MVLAGWPILPLKNKLFFNSSMELELLGALLSYCSSPMWHGRSLLGVFLEVTWVKWAEVKWGRLTSETPGAHYGSPEPTISSNF